MKPSCELARATLGKRACGLGRYILSAAVPLWLSLAAVPAQVPQLLNYQGRVQVGTTDFNGTGQFKFALVNADGNTTYWSNDGTPAGQPASSVTLPVTKGLYSVLLGNTALPNMNGVPPAAIANGDVHLRVWFNDGANGFQQFVPDQRIAAAAYAVTAGSLTGSISVDQLPSGVPRATNGTTTIAGNVVVQGTLIGAGARLGGAVGSSGLPAGTTLEVLINNELAPGVRFEGFSYEVHGSPTHTPGSFDWPLTNTLILSRSISDLSWPGIFEVPPNGPFTNPPISLRLSLPNGGQIVWTVAGGEDALTSKPYYGPRFTRAIGKDGRPYERVELLSIYSGIRALTRSNINLSAIGTVPSPIVGEPVSGQPTSSSMRLIVNNVNYNNVVFQGVLDPQLVRPIEVVLNPSNHQSLSALANATSPPLSIEVMLLNGLPGNVSLVQIEPGPQVRGPYLLWYELRLANDGLPYEVLTFGQNL